MSISNGSNEHLWLRKVSEHGLGHLLSPLGPKDRSKRWIAEGWEWILGRGQAPPWFEAPAISRLSITSPHVLGAFDDYNAARTRLHQVRPFNFCLVAHVAPFGHPEGVNPLRFRLIAPYQDDPSLYLDLEWIDQFTGDSFAVTTADDFGASGAVLLQTLGDVFAHYARHVEAKSLDADGKPGRGAGHLSRRPVREGSRTYIGKESNRIEDVEMGLWHRIEDVMTEYGRAHDPWASWVVPVLKRMPLSLLEDETGLDRRTIQRNRNEHSKPHPRNAVLLSRAAGTWARLGLQERGLPASRNDVLACRAWVERSA